MKCPTDGAALRAEGGIDLCGRCGGALCSADALEAEHPGYLGLLSPETDPKSGAFERVRPCASCGGVTTPYRVERMQAWVARCAACETYWLDKRDRDTATRLGAMKARQRALAAMPAEERRELAQAIVAVEASEAQISPAHAVAAVLGFPVPKNVERKRSPYLSVSIALLLTLIFVFGDENQVERFGYDNQAPALLGLFTASFIHFGWMHLIGNAYFLLAFGDALEQRLPAWLFVVFYLFVGPFSLFADGVFSDHHALIAGASGAVSGVVGAAVMVQKQARIVVGILGHAVELPIRGYLAIFLGWQLFHVLFGSNVAWVAHLVGLVLGILFGMLVGVFTARPH